MPQIGSSNAILNFQTTILQPSWYYTPLLENAYARVVLGIMFYGACEVYGFILWAVYTQRKSAVFYNQPATGTPAIISTDTRFNNYSCNVLIAICVLLVYSLVGSCGVGGSGDLVSRRGAGGVLPPHHPHPHPADFPHPLRFNCMDICSSFTTVGSLSK